MTELSTNWQNAITKSSTKYLEELKNDGKSKLAQAKELGEVCQGLIEEYSDVTEYDIDFNLDEIESIKEQQKDDKERISVLREKIINKEATEDEKLEYENLNAEYKELGNNLQQIVQNNNTMLNDALTEISEQEVKNKSALDYAETTLEVANEVAEKNKLGWLGLLAVDVFSMGIINGAISGTNQQAITSATVLEATANVNETFMETQKSKLSSQDI